MPSHQLLGFAAGASALILLVTFGHSARTTVLPVTSTTSNLRTVTSAVLSNQNDLYPSNPQAVRLPLAQQLPAQDSNQASATSVTRTFSLRFLTFCAMVGASSLLIFKSLSQRKVSTTSPLQPLVMCAASGKKEGDVDITIFRPVGTLIPGERREGNLSGRFTEDFDDRLASAVGMGWRKFKRELLQLGRAVLPQGDPTQDLIKVIRKLTLSNEEIDKREQARAEIPTTPPVRFIYGLICRLLDVAFEDRPIPRFWVLETVARMPYFAYMTTLHLYETLGWWRSPELREVHSAEEDNEAHHLMIMEALGGDMKWLDRFLAQHGAIIYYWVLVAFYLVDPRYSYNFSRMLESHAVDTYGQFVDENEEVLKRIPAPPVAVDYYKTGDLYLFDKFAPSQRDKPKEEWRRPPCTTLYDVFSNIRDDELEHVTTMHACEMWIEGKKSPLPLGPIYDMDKYLETMNNSEGRRAWKEWSKGINDTLKE